MRANVGTWYSGFVVALCGVACGSSNSGSSTANAGNAGAPVTAGAPSAGAGSGGADTGGAGTGGSAGASGAGAAGSSGGAATGSAGTNGSAGASTGGGAGSPSKTTFFVTSDTSTTANLGGLAGADARCQKLAVAAGFGDHTFHAYLSVEHDPANPSKSLNARDRIGTGPWYNSLGVLLAQDLAALHALSGNSELFLDEKGKKSTGNGSIRRPRTSMTCSPGRPPWA